LMSPATFTTRVAAMNNDVNGAGMGWLALAGAGFLGMLGALVGGDSAEWIGNACMFLFLGASAVWMIIAARNERGAAARAGLLCPVCGAGLPGGRQGEITKEVLRTGRCQTCKAPVLGNASMEAVESVAESPAGADFAERYRGRLSEMDDRLGRRRTVGLVIGVLSMFGQLPLVMLVPGGRAPRLMMLYLVTTSGIFFWLLFSKGSVIRDAGLLCRQCGKSLVDRERSIVRTGQCPHCGLAA
jgi:hypothetical protein